MAAVLERVRVSALTSGQRSGAALLAGVATVLGFAPFGLAWVPLLTVALLAALWLAGTPRQAGWVGWWFGVGLMGAGVSWMYISIDLFGGVTPPLAALATLLFVLVVALYYALLGWLFGRLAVGVPRGYALLLLLPGLWVGVEWLRGWLFTGFPWLSLGYSQIDTPLAGLAPVVGVLGVSWAVVTLAGALAWLPGVGWRRRLVAVGGLGVLLYLVAAGLASHAWSESAGERLRVALVQGNIAQERKWEPGEQKRIIDHYLALTLPLEGVQLVVWPETAIPLFADQVERGLLEPLEVWGRERGSELLLGVPLRSVEQGRYYNAMLHLDGERGAGERGYYAKRHLVPFGEFMPFKPLLGPLFSWLRIPLSDFSAGEAERPLMELAGYAVGVSICYEDAFGREVRQALPEAALLINASNDAWFGDSLAPHQHLEIARMRALEGERWLLRATNTGISALIDPQGRVVAQLPLFVSDRLVGEVEPRQGATPYVRFGEGGVFLGWILVLLGWCFFKVLGSRF